MTELNAKNLHVRSQDAKLVEAASFQLSPGELVILLGPNGAGKTSLIRGALGLVPLESGKAALDTEDISTLSPEKRARRIAYLPQARPLAWPNRVRDVVALGRFCHGASLGPLRGEDSAAVERALNACAIADLADRNTDTLSGGELARVHCARAMAAEAPLLVADEPTSALDPRHQFRIMDLIRDFVEKGGGALVVLHDIQLAARYATRFIWMKSGRIVSDGPPAETLTEDRLAEVYGLRVKVDGLRVEIEGAV